MGKDVDELAVFMSFPDRAGERDDVLRGSSLLGKDVLRAVNALEFYGFVVGLVLHLVSFFTNFRQ